ncbi:hypothetical protein MAR_028284 [Mya arenaria]|uniref:Uncharacterized protein n=1 Tax=Mya arenaria TaxID=6604 RepID=A0ABY7DD83_MYAAR|nr:hypothetical protein MAR_028284 [Mya arenaria]
MEVKDTVYCVFMELNVYGDTATNSCDVIICDFVYVITPECSQQFPDAETGDKVTKNLIVITIQFVLKVSAGLDLTA